MANPWAGEVAVTLNGVPHVAKLTLGALVEVETQLGTGSLVEIAERFEAGRFTARDVLVLLLAGLKGGGWSGEMRDLAEASIGGGPMGAVRAAAALLARAFYIPDAEK